MKLKEYVMFQQKELNKVIDEIKELKDLETFAGFSLKTVSKINITVSYELNDTEYFFELLVNVDLLEENKNKVIETIKLVANQIKLENYDCRKIKSNDKWGSILNNEVNNYEIILLNVNKGADVLYDKNVYDKEHGFI